VPLRHEGRLIYCKAWNFGERAAELSRGAKIDVLFTLNDEPGSKARGYDGWSVCLKDVRPTSD
jgi:hypothetical protein